MGRPVHRNESRDTWGSRSRATCENRRNGRRIRLVVRPLFLSAFFHFPGRVAAAGRRREGAEASGGAPGDRERGAGRDVAGRRRLRQSPKAAIHLPWGQKVLRALLAAGTPVFSTNLYQSWPRLFRPLIPRSACGIDVVLRASALAPTKRNGGPSAPARFDHASQDFRGERVNRWANSTEKNDLAATKPVPCGRADGRLASYNKGDFLDIVQPR